jgi:hypothetical protein
MSPIVLLAIEALRAATQWGIPAAIAFIESIKKPDATVDDILIGLQRAHKPASDYLAEARARLLAGQPAEPTPGVPIV